MIKRTLIAAVALSSLALAQTQPAKPPPPQPTIAVGQGGKIVYKTDSKGNRVPDFSYAGYRGGDAAIPDVPVRVVVNPVAGDNTSRIQGAIDHVASLPADQRGAVLLAKGRFDIHGALKIAASGAVLRGSGAGEGGTVLVAAGHDRRTLITIAGKDDFNYSSPAIAIVDDYVPVNAMKFRVADPSALKAGGEIAVTRPCNQPWIDAIGMNTIGGDPSVIGTKWKPDTRVQTWYRTITAVDDNTVSIDAPITTALEAQFGGGTVRPFTWAGRVINSGVENLRCESAYDKGNPKDEAHSWIAIQMDDARDCWVRQVTFQHFAGSAVTLLDNTQRITVEDCKSLAPISENAGFRRHTFVTYGQQALFQRCYSENGRHDFAVGYHNAGPNAFVQCEAVGALSDSGPIDSWATGVLYDYVRMEGSGISLMNRGHNAQFAGWSAGNSMLWQCSAPLLTCENPPTAMNWAIGCWGKYEGNGQWEQCDEFVRPTSLYYGQLAERLGADAAKRADWMMTPNDSASNPPRGQDPATWAAAFIKMAERPAPLLADWIENASTRRPIPIDATGPKLEELSTSTFVADSVSVKHPMSIKNGGLVVDGVAIQGSGRRAQYWRGGIRPEEVTRETSLTRFVPGRTGAGLTDDLNQLAASMLESGSRGFEHHYGLWYDRRNDDHERIRRADADAWPPFFEMPFARSGGSERAWDGLSKYDLTKYNPWYWDRLRQFADLCDQKGLVLFHDHFFQHNILEAGAHWASCPWRTANNINNMGFPEPPNYAGDKRIFMAEQFYDVTHPVRPKIYRAYIRRCLDNYGDNTNVVHLISAEFTGPTAFTQFWLDTIGEWERETGKNAMVGLAVPKNVQDAILADPARAKIVDIIYIRPELYAVPGGANLAPRQWSRVNPVGGVDQQVFSELRQKFPEKAVIGGGRGGRGAQAD